MSTNRVGRPTKYNDELQAEADAYLSRLEELKHFIPSRAGLCCYLGIAKSTSYEWEAQYPEFSDTLKTVDVMQEHLTLNGGLSGSFNSTISKLVLANHGYSDKQAIDHTTAGNPIAPTRIELVAPGTNDDR